ncbi:NACHT domain-containing protein [Dickeya zeae]|uniref:NACHT domain-containing protein n=1 Tax=Dickeya zeae TaxID=204042 RepID=UPI002097C822|nr:hypothetical protein [Dickeya zeae]MCO7261137.1 hypothetical protein [Dickeya zeae]
MISQPVPLVRNFSLIPESEIDSDEVELHLLWNTQKCTGWQALEKEYRSVILAEAGAGKSFEMEARASHIHQSGRMAFFIRIEDIEEGFENAFEIGSEADLEEWLDSQDEAWFFLDSVDEARLENPRAFEKAIKRFAMHIKQAQHRAHVFISSRPYAWRARSDRELLERYLPFEKTKPNSTGNGKNISSEIDIDKSIEPQSGLHVYLLDPLDEMGIRTFAIYRQTPQVDRLIIELQRANLMSIAARPFDLESIVIKWKTDKKLDGRLNLLQHNITLRLREIDPNRTQRQPLNLEKAIYGARLLAAAVILTGEPGIRIPDAIQTDKGIDAETILGDWEPSEVRALLERGIFNDVLYGIVRFRHREVRELLAAEWFSHQLKLGYSRRVVESLFIREQYGNLVITPRLRPLLPWLILFDNEIRYKVLKIAPEIAVEGGDAAYLPLVERQAILADVVKRITEDEDSHSARDNDAIARIAQQDLASDTLGLIRKYRNNDDAIFFLGRLVWQGEMVACVPALFDIAVDPTRGIYARIAAARAVMTCGERSQKDHLWSELSTQTHTLPRRLLAEVLGNADPDMLSVNLLLASIDKLEAYKRYEATGLSQVLHDFIECLPSNHAVPEILVAVVRGLKGYLEREPYIEEGKCDVSKAYIWLLGPAIHAVERLVSTRSEAALSSEALAVMLMVPAVRFWRSGDFKEYKSVLSESVPAWKELNDALFWRSIEDARGRSESNKSERLVNYLVVQWIGHYWEFGIDRFDDVLSYVTTRDFLDDKLVALSLAFRLYKSADEPCDWLNKLRYSAEEGEDLKEYLDSFLNPNTPQEVIKWQEEEARRNHKWKKEKEKRERNRMEWIEHLKATPNVVRCPSGLKPGELSNDQYWLLSEIEDKGIRSNHSDGANWEALIPEFGLDVAEAYRDAAVLYWKSYTPALGSEGCDIYSVPYQVIFGMAGLEIEASENNSFPSYLTEEEARHALRYFVWQINGLPSWLEHLHRVYPELVLDAVLTELRWELIHADSGHPMNYILHDLAYHAAWMHKNLAPPIITYIEQYEIYNADVLRYCIYILRSGNSGSEVLSNLAQSKIENNVVKGQLSVWFALWVDLNAEEAIRVFEKWLLSLPVEEASKEAQLFITKLMGARYLLNTRSGHGDFLNVRHLKALYILMHQYIRSQDDIERVNGGVYSPELRDDAQDGRNALFNKLSAIPGKETYVALIELSREHPNVKYRSWMGRLAYKRAEEDADLEPWSVQQVRDYGKHQVRTPRTHRQLFDLTVERLIDLKVWIECGSDSPYKTWQKVDGETEMRNLVAGWLNNKSIGNYTCAQENELPNRQRPDILIQHACIPSPVPIELKLLDNWTGPELCERLRNQLAGDYLREETAGCGVMLLIWKGKTNQLHWQIGDLRVSLPNLDDALKSYWNSIASDFPGVVAIDVILIDLTVREQKSRE